MAEGQISGLDSRRPRTTAKGAPEKKQCGGLSSNSVPEARHWIEPGGLCSNPVPEARHWIALGGLSRNSVPEARHWIELGGLCSNPVPEARHWIVAVPKTKTESDHNNAAKVLLWALWPISSSVRFRRL